MMQDEVQQVEILPFLLLALGYNPSPPRPTWPYLCAGPVLCASNLPVCRIFVRSY